MQNNGSLTTTNGYLAVAGSGSNDASKTKKASNNIVTVQISGTYTGLTFVFEGLSDGTNWAPLDAKDMSTGQVATGTISPADSITRIWNVDALGSSNVRLRVTAITGGTLTVNAFDMFVEGPAFMSVNNAGQTMAGITVANTVLATGDIISATGQVIAGGTVIATGNIISATGNVLVGGTVRATGNIISVTGNVLAGGTVNATGNIISATGNIIVGGNVTATGNVLGTGSVLSAGATAGVGYAAGAGGTVVQTNNKTAAVTLNKAVGQITMTAAALTNAGIVSFGFTNSVIAANDLLIVNVVSGETTAGSYDVWPCDIASGSCKISVQNVSGATLSEAVVLGYAIIKGVVA